MGIKSKFLISLGFTTISIGISMLGCPTCVEKISSLNVPFFSQEQPAKKAHSTDALQELKILSDEILNELNKGEKQ